MNDNGAELREIFTKNDVTSSAIREKALEIGSHFLAGGWTSIGPDDVTLLTITGGYSNLLYLVSVDQTKMRKNDVRRFLLRIQCQPDAKQIFNDNIIFSALAERGIGPKMYGLFEGGRLEEFIESRTLEQADVRTPDISRKVGAGFARIHQLDIPIPKRAGALAKMREWINAARVCGMTKFEMKTHSVNYESSEIPSELSLDMLDREVEFMENAVKRYEDTVNFSHNDLAPPNILEKTNKELMFIDYEYSSYNWRGFDIGMHLSEFAVDYSDPTPPACRIDQNLLENNPNTRIVCEGYIDELYKIKSSNPLAVFPKTDDRELEVQNLMRESDFFVPITHFFWAVYSIKSHLEGYEIGMDLMTIACDRLAVYYHLKKKRMMDI